MLTSLKWFQYRSVKLHSTSSNQLNFTPSHWENIVTLQMSFRKYYNIVSNLDTGGSRFDAQALMNAIEDTTLVGGTAESVFLQSQWLRGGWSMSWTGEGFTRFK